MTIAHHPPDELLTAFTAGVLTDFDKTITDWSTAHNPFFEGVNADLLSMLPYALLIALLIWAGREKRSTR